MSALTMTDLLARFRTVLEAEPLSLLPTRDAFSHDRQPTTVLTHSYYLEDGGNVASQSVGNYDAVRMDRVTIYVAQKLDFDGVSALGDLETTLTAIERALIADGPAQSYSIAPQITRRVTRAPGADVAVGSLALTADFDYDEV
jgi:hypothetical protein